MRGEGKRLAGEIASKNRKPLCVLPPAAFPQDALKIVQKPLRRAAHPFLQEGLAHHLSMHRSSDRPGSTDSTGKRLLFRNEGRVLGNSHLAVPHSPSRSPLNLGRCIGRQKILQRQLRAQSHGAIAHRHRYALAPAHVLVGHRPPVIANAIDPGRHAGQVRI